MVKRNVTRRSSLSSPMASSGFLHLLILTSSLLIILTVSGESHRPCYDSIISFGDSLADTGNLLRFGDLSFVPYFALPPYGETFFHHPTGRFSDGRLIIDFIAEFLGLPFVPPYVGSENKSFEKGINFAVAGATALDITYFKDKAIIESLLTNVSLGVQLNIFKEMLPSICHSSSNCREFLSRSLILMGEIGGNDYNYPFFLKRNVKEIKRMVPSVINVISSAIKELIEIGGKTFLVPGDFPIGCSTVYLTTYQTTNSEDYDPLTGCLTWLNEFAEYHNEQLQTELNRLRKLYPHVNIIYADYYNVLLRLYQEPTKYGFINRPLSACCGVGGSYNFSSSRQCGYGVPYCEDPSKYVNWDGVHLTEAAYRWIAKGLLKGPYADPPFNLSCFDIKLQSSSQDNHMSLSI